MANSDRSSNHLAIHTSLVIAILQYLLLNIVKAYGSTFQELPSSQDEANNFKPSIGVVIGILSIMFSLTFLLLLYAKFCRRSPLPVHNAMQIHQDGLATTIPMSRSSSGIDKTVIESLPFFRFSFLKGSREGLECAVCLSRFEDVEVLRLLPKCKHAFHINCIDQWLEKHSSCPLCRHKVSAEDHTLLTYSNSFRFLNNQSELREDSNLEFYVQREENCQNGHNKSSRFSIGSISFKKSEKGVQEDEIPIKENSFFDQTEEKQDRIDLLHFHKFNHRIVVSDVVLKQRWSNVSSSDFMFLNSEMIHDMTSNNQFLSSSESRINNTSKVLRQNEKRAMSEISICPRFDDFSTRNCNRESCCVVSHNVKEENRRKLWLPIARRTVQWFANREKRYAAAQPENTAQSFNV